MPFAVFCGLNVEGSIAIALNHFKKGIAKRPRVNCALQGVSYTSAQKRKSMKVCFLGFRSQEELTKSAEVNPLHCTSHGFYSIRFV